MNTSDAPVPPIHDALVTRLKADVRPLRPLWPPSVRLAFWLVVAAAVVAGAAQLGLRNDLGRQLGQPLYLSEIAALLGAGVLAAAAALLAAVPGRGGRGLSGLALTLAFLAVAILGCEALSAAVPRVAFVSEGLPCIFYVAVYGLLPWAALFIATARAAPLDGGAVGVYAGAAAFLIGAAAVRVACPIDDPLHVLAWHMPAIALWSCLSGVAGAVWLGRGQRIAV